MSGGHWDYIQFRIDEVSGDVNQFLGNGYSKETLDKFKKAVYALRRASIMTNRIDYLLCGDDGEEQFNKRWDHDLEQLDECPVTPYDLTKVCGQKVLAVSPCEVDSLDENLEPEGWVEATIDKEHIGKQVTIIVLEG